MKRIQKIVPIILGIIIGISSCAFLPSVHSEPGVTVTVTLSGGDHTVALGAIVFTRHSEEGKVLMDHMAFDDPTYEKFKCGPGETKSMTFEVPQVPNDLEIIYISDGGAQTPYTIPTHRFQFGKKYSLPSPSPGTPQEPPPGDPPGDATIQVTLPPVRFAPYIYDSRQFCPVPQNRLSTAQKESETIQQMIGKAEESDLTQEQQENLEEARELQEQAANLIREAALLLESRNCIPANNRLLEAESLLTKCMGILLDIFS
ncbi:MAG: hypothetical protein HXS44_08055 [Theionarchaea archaeon]|nr:hypothetical protein [Theionarchaea archaeon]